METEHIQKWILKGINASEAFDDEKALDAYTSLLPYIPVADTYTTAPRNENDVRHRLYQLQKKFGPWTKPEDVEVGKWYMDGYNIDLVVAKMKDAFLLICVSDHEVRTSVYRYEWLQSEFMWREIKKEDLNLYFTPSEDKALAVPYDIKDFPADYFNY